LASFFSSSGLVFFRVVRVFRGFPLIPLRRARIPLAWRLLTHHKGRLALSLAGVAFAALPMFMEMGFLFGVYDSAAEVIRLMNADLFVIGRHKEAVTPVQPFARRRLTQARGHPAVAAAYPVYARGLSVPWKAPPEHRGRGILVYGIDPDDPVFLIPEVAEHAALLKRADTALFDSRSKAYYGDRLPGTAGELGRRKVRVVGTFPLGPDFRVDGNLIVSDETFWKVFADPRTGGSAVSGVEYGLIKLVPGADPAGVRDDLRRELPDDVRVLTKGELVDEVQAYWTRTQPIGFVFALGMAAGFVIGVAICYQTLYTDVSDHLAQYATLQAMGYSTGRLVGVVLKEALYLGVLGFVPGLLVSLACYAGVEAASGIPMRLTAGRAAVVLGLTVLMCAASGLLALRRLLRNDPAEVF
jgi:putative ABC transport system permease protein